MGGVVSKSSACDVAGATGAVSSISSAVGVSSRWVFGRASEDSLAPTALLGEMVDRGWAVFLMEVLRCRGSAGFVDGLAGNGVARTAVHETRERFQLREAQAGTPDEW